MRKACLALAFLLLLCSEVFAQWPLPVLLVGTRLPPTSWIADGLICYPTLVTSRRGVFAFNRSECNLTYRPQERAVLCCLMAADRRTARFFEALTAKHDRPPLPRHTIAQAAAN